MREQPTRVRTGALQRRLLIAAVALATAGIVAAGVMLYMYEPPYAPPPPEQNAAQGVPKPPDNIMYGILDAAGQFKFGVAGTMYQQADGSLKIYLTNPAENGCLLMCEVKSAEDGSTLYRSGLIDPGQYVESLYPLQKIENEPIRVEVFVYALEPETYISAGQVSLDNTLQPN